MAVGIHAALVELGPEARLASMGDFRKFGHRQADDGW
jgi:hypothetical protein